MDIDVQRSVGDFSLDVQIDCAADGVTALFGRSGSGKTTLVNLIAGLERPDRGRIVIGGTTLFDAARGIDLPTEHRRLGYVFQDARLFPHFSVEGNLRYGMGLDNSPIDFDQVVDLLGLGNLLARRPYHLSGGEAQRVAIGRALLANPRLLLMDEPLASLDAPRKDEILDFIERLRDRLKIPIVYVSHIMEEVIRLADDMVVLSAGRVAAVGTVEDVTSRLDLRPLTGRYEAGAVLAARVDAHDDEFDLSYLAVPGGRLSVSRLDVDVGTSLRVRIRARDVSLALEPPSRSSVLNVFAGTVADIGDEPGAQVDVLVHIGDGDQTAPLWARITRKSAHLLGLKQGQPVYALVKSVALDRHSLGRGAAAGRFVGHHR
ncbi:MAG: molybdenum ABC transporter ATP-binding protein [Pseudomonadota bacterium]|nr:molybdenum ABC transporter ATP-binding protein [Pseudomonadota bacterium]